MDPTGAGQAGKFHWWEGVVEDNLDPVGSGRCKVRVIAQNSPLKSDLTTTELPWAYPIMPLNNPHGKIVALKPGTRVTGFYRDGVLGQDLVMMGTINTGYGTALGFDETQPPLDAVNLSDQIPRVGDIGFVDDRAGAGGPIEKQPQKTLIEVDDDGKFSHENTSDYGPLVVNEINTPRLTRGIIAGTTTEAHHKSQQLTSVTRPDETMISEPDTPYAALYPFNTVEESDSGHVKEIDDTPGAERIKETHRTGTFYEIHPDGTKVTKVVKDEFSVTIGDRGIKVDGVCAVHVMGQADFYCESDVNIKSEMDATVQAVNVIVEATNDVSATAGTDVFAAAGNDVFAAAGRDLSATSARDTLVTAGKNLDVISAGEMSIQAGGEILFKDSSATASNVDEIIKDTVDGKGNSRIRVDDPS